MREIAVLFLVCLGGCRVVGGAAGGAIAGKIERESRQDEVDAARAKEDAEAKSRYSSFRFHEKHRAEYEAQRKRDREAVDGVKTSSVAKKTTRAVFRPE